MSFMCMQMLLCTSLYACLHMCVCVCVCKNLCVYVLGCANTCMCVPTKLHLVCLCAIKVNVCFHFSAEWVFFSVLLPDMLDLIFIQ